MVSKHTLKFKDLNCYECAFLTSIVIFNTVNAIISK